MSALVTQSGAVTSTLLRVARITARLFAAAWLVFWLWFVVASSINDGPPPWPVALSLLAMLLAPPTLTVIWPRIGGLAFLLVGVGAAAYFGSTAAVLLLALPAMLIGILLLAIG